MAKGRRQGRWLWTGGRAEGWALSLVLRGGGGGGGEDGCLKAWASRDMKRKQVTRQMAHEARQLHFTAFTSHTFSYLRLGILPGLMPKPDRATSVNALKDAVKLG